MAVIEGMAASAAANAMNYGVQSMLLADEQRNYQNNMKLGNKLQQELQVNTPANLAKGFQKAGFSPALAAGNGFSTPAQPSAPMSNKQAPVQDVAGMTQAIQVAKLQEAQAENLKAQTEAQTIKNERMKQEDSQYNTLIANTIGEWKKKVPEDDVIRKLYDDIEQNPEKFSKGTFDALKDATDFSAFVRETAARASEADLKNLITAMQQRGGIYRDIAKLPVEELSLMVQEQKLKRALAVNAYAQAKTEGEEQKRLQAQQKELEARAKNIDEETRRLRYGKYGNMFEHGDYDAAVADILGGAAEEGSKTLAKESVELGADIVRAKTGTPHGIFRTNNKSDVSTSQKPSSRETRTDKWRDRYGEHEIRHEDAFPMTE